MSSLVVLLTDAMLRRQGESSAWVDHRGLDRDRDRGRQPQVPDEVGARQLLSIWGKSGK
jgi:hypothetical protein